MQIIEATDPKIYNRFLTEQSALPDGKAGSVLQSWEWGEFQKKIGRRVWRLLLSNNIGRVRAVATIVKHPWPRNLHYLYCPKGPVVANSEKINKIWELFVDKISDIASMEKSVFLRLEPPNSFNQGSIKLMRGLGFRKIPWHMQPNDSVILNLEKTEPELLHQMKPKTRYNIRLAEKRGVTVETHKSERYLKDFWNMMKETTARDKFSPHPYLYYLNLLDVLGHARMAELYVATYKQRPLAAVLVSFFGGTATYLHGASSDKLRALMAPYLLQWIAIKDAKKRGMKFYDFGGVSPQNSPQHPWAGISRFKRGFGGSEVSFGGTYDLIYRKWWYLAYRVVRKIR